jgi:hypothetical protein
MVFTILRGFVIDHLKGVQYRQYLNACMHVVEKLLELPANART